MARTRTKPFVTSPCVAEKSNRDVSSRIIEFGGHDGNGLIQLENRMGCPGFLVVELYRLSENVKVRVDPKYLDIAPADFKAFEAALKRAKKMAALDRSA